MGDSGFPTRPYMLTPYDFGEINTDKERKFNYLVSSVRVTVERVIG